MQKLITTFLLNFLAFPVLFGQSFPDSAKTNSILYEKLYLHTDRDIYSPDDDIWFKSYLVSGINNRLIPGYKNIYVQLISENGNVVDERLMLSVEGVANNDFHLPESVSPGNYTIRAYTKYLQNFGEESLFHKNIVVASAESSPPIQPADSIQKKIAVSFLPEGGTLMLNAANYIAFKAIDETGRGINVSGKVVDENGAEVASFKSRYKGMGSFLMMPAEGKSYTAKIDGYPGLSFRFDEAKSDGIALHYQPKGNHLLFTLNRNIKLSETRKVVLVASCKGLELFRKEIQLSGFQYPVEIYKGNFPPGISKITVYGEAQQVLAERLVFVRNASEKTLQVAPGKNEYATRKPVNIDIAALIDEGDSIKNSFSVAVVNADYFGAGGISQTIESYLLLDSELKGPLESPASFFQDDETISADEKLDLVMMVNGWRRYYWDDLQKYAGTRLPGWDDIGLELAGNVKKLFGQKPVVGGTVEVGPFSRNFLIEKDTTDEEGAFSVDRLYLKDSALIMVNAKTKNGSRGVEIIHQPSEIFDTSIPVDEMKKATRELLVPDKFYRSNYYQQLARRRFQLENEGILLDDIDIIRKKRNEPDGHFRLYGEPDNSFKITKDDWTYTNILDYLEGRVAGVVVTGDEVRIRSAETNPMFLVDGLEVEWTDILYMPMGDIDKIEILKTGATTAMYGSRGADGVISVFTRTGEEAFQNEFTRNVRGRITPRVRGFKQSREFYSPQYPLNQLDEMSARKYDFRPALYWNPNVFFENNEASLQFYTSDMLGHYLVVVEGISKKGKICYGTAALDVVAGTE